jgi:mannosylglucosylglycerate synthase
MAVCAIVSFRLGLADGVSVVAETWRRAFGEIGFAVRTIAGEGPVDITVPGLAIGATAPPSPAELQEALRDVDLVVVENMLSIPMNLPASLALAAAIERRPAILHHHDPPWQRERYAHITALPPRDPAWRHVTINELTRRQMAERGIAARTIYNSFDVDAPPGNREATRAAFAIAPEERLIVHPVRAIARKNIPKALEIAETVGATYWLLGAAEEGYGPELARIIAGARTRVIHRGSTDRAGFYAAADIVAFPSTWEGFGNPPIEAAIYRRPVVVGHYPVAEELRTMGFRWLDPDDPAAIASWFTVSDAAVLDHNQALAHRRLSHESMRDQLTTLLREADWLP